MSVLAKYRTDLSQYRMDNIKDQFQLSLSKLANNVSPGSALLFGDDLDGRIESLNNTANLRKLDKVMNTRKYLVKTKKACSRPKDLSAYDKKEHPR